MKSAPESVIISEAEVEGAVAEGASGPAGEAAFEGAPPGGAEGELPPQPDKGRAAEINMSARARRAGKAIPLDFKA